VRSAFVRGIPDDDEKDDDDEPAVLPKRR